VTSGLAWWPGEEINKEWGHAVARKGVRIASDVHRPQVKLLYGMAKFNRVV